MLQHLNTELEADPQAPDKMELSPTSVISGKTVPPEGGPAAAAEAAPSPEPSAEPAGPSAELSQSTQTEEGDDAAPTTSPMGEESLAQLRALGRQLLQGWAEALGTLGKLPGVGNMRVEALAARLQQLSHEASTGAAEGSSSGAGGVAVEPMGPFGSAAAAASRSGGPPPLHAAPTSELAGPNSQQRQSYSDPVDMFATAAKSAHLSYPELLHAFAASAEGLDDEALADYLFNLAMLCAEPPENELVVRPVLSLPQNSEEQQQYRRRQAVSSSAPVDAMLAAMQQQQQQAGPSGQQHSHQQQVRGMQQVQQQQVGGGGGGLTHEAIWQQIVSQQQPVQHGQQQQQQHGQYGRLSAPQGRSPHHHHAPSRSKSDVLGAFEQALGDVQMQGLLRGASMGNPGQQQQQQYQQQQRSFQQALAAVGPMSPTRGLQSPSGGGGVGGSSLHKAVSAPERDLWMAAASLASGMDQQQQHTAAAAAAAAAAASANFSFHPQPASPSFGRMPQLQQLGGGGNSALGGPAAGSGSAAGGSGLWSNNSGSGISRNGGSGAGSSLLHTLSDFSY